jgi:predicted RNA-binding protein with PUA-like domain
MPLRKTEDRISHWLWVTKPEFYADDDGTDRKELDPSSNEDADGAWTCHADTQQGDVALLWRASPRRDIAYLIQVVSDAYALEDADSRKRGWSYACEYLVRAKFAQPIKLADLRSVPHLQEWGALRGNFQRSAFGIPDDHWARLVRLILKKNPRLAPTLRAAESHDVPRRVLLEEDIENHLVADLTAFRKHGLRLELRGRQLVCSSNGGRIDLLCFDKAKERFVVIELKNVRAGRNTFGQILSYLGWISENMPSRRKPLGIVVARGTDRAFQDAASIVPSIQFIDLADLGFT